jgi:hypothetical protein
VLSRRPNARATHRLSPLARAPRARTPAAATSACPRCAPSRNDASSAEPTCAAPPPPLPPSCARTAPLARLPNLPEEWHHLCPILASRAAASRHEQAVGAPLHRPAPLAGRPTGHHPPRAAPPT